MLGYLPYTSVHKSSYTTLVCRCPLSCARRAQTFCGKEKIEKNNWGMSSLHTHYTYAHTHTHIPQTHNMHMHTHTHTRTHTHMHTHKCTHARTDTHTHTHTHTHTCTHIHSHTHSHACAHTHTCTHTPVHQRNIHACECTFGIYVLYCSSILLFLVLTLQLLYQKCCRNTTQGRHRQGCYSRWFRTVFLTVGRLLCVNVFQALFKICETRSIHSSQMIRDLMVFLDREVENDLALIAAFCSVIYNIFATSTIVSVNTSLWKLVKNALREMAKVDLSSAN